MFGIKTAINRLLDKPGISAVHSRKIPEKPISPLAQWSVLHRLRSVMESRRKAAPHSIGHLVSFPPSSAVRVWNMLVPFNPGNLGNWSFQNRLDELDTRLLERQLIKQLAALYHTPSHTIEGYFTSGSTEANIFSCWAGKNQLIKEGIPRDKICLLSTSLSHYSLSKAARISYTDSFLVSLGHDYTIDVNAFERKVIELKQDYQGFLIPLTLGYTLTGTDDDIERLIPVVNNLKKNYPELKFFIWVDAALSGLIRPFVSPSFAPFKYPEIQTFSADFHKLFGAPIPSSVILYRPSLRPLISQPIGYLSQEDTTVLGSRTGIAPAACWYVLNCSGKDNLVKKMKSLLDHKRTVLKQIKDKYPAITLIDNDLSLNAGIIAPPSIAAELERQYGLYFKKVDLYKAMNHQEVLISKAYFLTG